MRTLIATVTAGAGHLQAAAALAEAWRAARPADTVERGEGAWPAYGSQNCLPEILNRWEAAK